MPTAKKPRHRSGRIDHTVAHESLWLPPTDDPPRVEKLAQSDEGLIVYRDVIAPETTPAP